MRVLLWLMAAVAALWCGYWYVGARTVRHETETALAAMKAEGRADYTAVGLSGFPARFKLTIADPALSDPARGWSWRAASATVHALAYDPGRIIALFPAEQTVRVGGQTIALATTGMRASAGFGLSATLPLGHAEAISDATRARSDAGWSARAGQLRAAIRLEDAATNRYRLGAEATALTLGGAPARILRRAGLGTGPGRFRLDADARFDAPLDRQAAMQPPRTREVVVHALELDWDALSLRGDGTLAIDGQGLPEGTLALGLTNWRGLPPLLVAAGIIPADAEQRLTRTMEQLALLSGNRDELRLPLTFKAGWVALGPLPLGPAPRL